LAVAPLRALQKPANVSLRVGTTPAQQMGDNAFADKILARSSARVRPPMVAESGIRKALSGFGVIISL
jgi:hypothetical protein